MKQKNSPKVTKLTGQITYQEGSIVSKIIHKNEGGSLTLFAFDKGEGLTEHTSPFDAFVHILDGSAEVSISGKGYQVNEGEMIHLPANEPHALQALSRFKMMLAMIKE